jgi:hypothetical protein
MSKNRLPFRYVVIKVLKIIFSPFAIILIVFGQIFKSIASIFTTENIELIDEDFGQLQFVTSKKVQPYWESMPIIFNPTESEISFIIEADESGPTQKQREFYKDIETNYHKNFDTILYPFFKSEIEETRYKDEGLTEDEFKNGFLPETIKFHNFKNKILKWEITFTAEFDTHYFTIEMANWKTLNLQIDG